MNVKSLVFASLLSVLSLNAVASSFSYDYLKLDLGTTKFSDKQISEELGSGHNGTLSFASSINDLFYITGSVGRTAFKNTGSMIKYENTETVGGIGLGVHTNVWKTTDIYAGVTFEGIRGNVIIESIDFPGEFEFKNSDSGYGYNIGIRQSILTNYELAAGFNVLNFKDHDSKDKSYHVEGLIHANEMFDIGLAYKKREDDKSFNLVLKLNF